MRLVQREEELGLEEGPETLAVVTMGGGRVGGKSGGIKRGLKLTWTLLVKGV